MSDRRKPFSDTFIRSVKPPKAAGGKPTRDTYADSQCPGLKLRVTSAGCKTFTLFRRLDPKASSASQLALGEVGELTLEQARIKARLWIKLIRDGQDPRDVERAKAEGERRAKVAEEAKAANTVQAAWERYKAAIAHQRSADKVAQIFNAELLPVFKTTPLHEIKRADVKDMVRKIARRSVHQAYAAFGNLRTFLNWARDEGDYGLEAVPTDGMRANKIVGKPRKPRKRVLTDTELFAFWRAVRPERWTMYVDKPWRVIRGQPQRVSVIYPDRTAMARGCRVLLLTGARLNEVLEADRRELNPESTVLTVPPERFKSDESHMIFLPAAAQAIIAKLPRRNEVTFLFTDDGKRAAKVWTKDRKRINRRMMLTLKALARLRGDDPKAVTLPPFVLHDLRRTVRTRLSSLKVPREIAEMVIGHGQKGLDRVYNQFEYADEIREALERWSARLAEIVKGSLSANVIEITGRMKRRNAN